LTATCEQGNIKPEWQETKNHSKVIQIPSSLSLPGLPMRHK